MEDNFDDLNGLNSYLNRFGPYVPTNFNVQSASSQPNLGFPSIPTQQNLGFAQQNFGYPSIRSQPLPPQPTQQTAPQTFTNNQPETALFQSTRAQPVPVQLGSGSLGYIRLPNGAVYLGSGSLGYVNDQQKVNQLSEIQGRQSPQASPVTFGEAPR